MKSTVRAKKKGWSYNCSASGAADTKTFSHLSWSRQELSLRSCQAPVCSPGNIQELVHLRALGLKAPSPSERPLQDFCPRGHHWSYPEEGWLISQLLSGAVIPYFLEGMGVCCHLVAPCDWAVLHAPHGSPPHPGCSGSQFTSRGALGKALCILGSDFHALTPSWAAQILLYKQWKKCFSHAKNPQGPGFWLRQDPKKRWG